MAILSFLSYLTICFFCFSCVICMFVVAFQQDKIKELEEDIQYITESMNKNTDRINDLYFKNKKQLEFLGLDFRKEN